MILLVFAVLGLGAGLISGGRFSNISKHEIRCLWLPIVAFAIKGLAPYGLSFLSVPVANMPVQVVVCIVQYGALAAFAVLNWRYVAWPAVFGFGTLCNFAVMVTNGGAMPVSARVASLAPDAAARFASGQVFGYTLETAATRLAFLGDTIYIGFGSWRLGFASIGDIFIGLGAALLCVQILRPTKQKKPATEAIMQEDAQSGT